MGKGLGLIGNFRGKVGNIIGYQLKNSKNKVTQGLRAWQPYVKNPQTMPQIVQRAKIQNVNNIYRALEPIISRGFENIEYGAKSRNEFLKLALHREGGPYTIKGTKTPVPGNYQISSGSLVPITISGGTQPTGAVTAYLQNDLGLPTTPARPETIGALSTMLIENNTSIENGDQLTFIAVYQYNDAFVYRWASILIDQESEETLELGTNGTASQMSYNGVNFLVSGTNITTSFNVGKVLADEVLVAGAVIQSREKGEQGHLRSNAMLWVDTAILSGYFGVAAMNNAYISYMKMSYNNDWPTQVTDATLSQSSRYSLVAVTVNITGFKVSTFQALAEVNEAGQGHIFYVEFQNKKWLVGTNGQRSDVDIDEETSGPVPLEQYKGTFTPKEYNVSYGTLS